MELRHLRYFQAVGREEHFGRAALRLRVAQPALTRQIQDLERELGVALFERLPRGVRLSAAGRVMLEDVTAILNQVENAVERARGFASGHIGTVRVGFSELASGHGAIPRRLLEFRVNEPDVSLDLMPLGSLAQLSALKRGALDAAIVYDIHAAPEDLQHLDSHGVGSAEIVLALYPGHPLVQKKEIFMKDLVGEPMLWPVRQSAPVYYERLITECLARGLSPRIVQETVTHSIQLSLVSAGMGIGFVTTSSNLVQAGDVQLRRLADFDLRFEIQLLWRKGDGSPALARFLEAMRRASENA